MAHKKPELNHELLTTSGDCAACQFMHTALRMMADEYKPEFRRMLDAALELHARQPEFWIPVNTEADAWLQ